MYIFMNDENIQGSDFGITRDNTYASLMEKYLFGKNNEKLDWDMFDSGILSIFDTVRGT
mgnify:CR=1 FL=1